MMTLFRVLMVLVILACLAPLASVLTAATVTDLYGCQFDEGSVHTCMIGGVDYGRELYMLGMMGWYMIATFPVMLGALALWLVVEVLRWFRLRKAESEA